MSLAARSTLRRRRRCVEVETIGGAAGTARPKRQFQRGTSFSPRRLCRRRKAEEEVRPRTRGVKAAAAKSPSTSLRPSSPSPIPRKLRGGRSVLSPGAGPCGDGTRDGDDRWGPDRKSQSRSDARRLPRHAASSSPSFSSSSAPPSQSGSAERRRPAAPRWTPSTCRPLRRRHRHRQPHRLPPLSRARKTGPAPVRRGDDSYHGSLAWACDSSCEWNSQPCRPAGPQTFIAAGAEGSTDGDGGGRGESFINAPGTVRKTRRTGSVRDSGCVGGEKTPCRTDAVPKSRPQHLPALAPMRCPCGRPTSSAVVSAAEVEAERVEEASSLSPRPDA